MPVFRPTYPIYRQHSEEDCGAACMAMIVKHYGFSIAIQTLREAVGTGQQGTTLLGLQRGAEHIGFHARPVRTSAIVLDQLQDMPLPAILHWQGNHWVVFYGQRRGQFIIADPAVGLRFLSRQQLEAGWSDWIALLLMPDLHRLADQPSTTATTTRYFIRSIGLYRGVVLETLLINAVLGVFALMTPFLIQILTDDVLVRRDLGLLNTVAIAIITLIGLSSVLGWVQANLILHFAKRLELGLVLKFSRQLLHLPLKYFESHRSGEVTSRLQDIQLINQLVAQAIVSVPGQGFVALVSLAVMGFYSGLLTAVALVISAGMALAPLLLLGPLHQKIRQELVLDSENQGFLIETFKGALTLKTLTAEPQFWHELQSRLGRLAHVGFQSAQIGIVNATLSGLVSGTGNIALLWLGSTVVMQGRLSIGQLLAFYSLNRNVVALISSLVGFLSEFTRGSAATQRLADVIDAPPEVAAEISKPEGAIACTASIECDDLTFCYPGQLDFIQHLSVTLPGGRVTGLTGPSGCGKSTLVKLMAGLYPLQSGNIRIGIYNLSDLSLESLRRQVILVPQDPQFWSRSILDNIRLGCPQASLEAVIEVCRVVDADSFICQLPNKYQTVLGEFGANLSGGQRQRLAIARALLHNPPILILDESTSGLDQRSESQVLDQLLAFRQGKTTILISHRPSVIQRTDWLVMLHGGTLAAQGPTQTLKVQRMRAT